MGKIGQKRELFAIILYQLNKSFRLAGIAPLALLILLIFDTTPHAQAVTPIEMDNLAGASADSRMEQDANQFAQPTRLRMSIADMMPLFEQEDVQPNAFLTANIALINGEITVNGETVTTPIADKIKEIIFAFEELQNQESTDFTVSVFIHDAIGTRAEISLSIQMTRQTQLTVAGATLDTITPTAYYFADNNQQVMVEGIAIHPETGANLFIIGGLTVQVDKDDTVLFTTTDDGTFTNYAYHLITPREGSVNLRNRPSTESSISGSLEPSDSILALNWYIEDDRNLLDEIAGDINGEIVFNPDGTVHVKDGNNIWYVVWFTNSQNDTAIVFIAGTVNGTQFTEKQESSDLVTLDRFLDNILNGQELQNQQSSTFNENLWFATALINGTMPTALPYTEPWRGGFVQQSSIESATATVSVIGGISTRQFEIARLDGKIITVLASTTIAWSNAEGEIQYATLILAYQTPHQWELSGNSYDEMIGIADIHTIYARVSTTWDLRTLPAYIMDYFYEDEEGAIDFYNGIDSPSQQINLATYNPTPDALYFVVFYDLSELPTLRYLVPSAVALFNANALANFRRTGNVSDLVDAGLAISVSNEYPVIFPDSIRRRNQ